MAATSKQFGQAIVGQYGTTAARRVDWVGDTIKVALLGSGYAPDQDAHDFYNDVSAQEVSGSGYTAGGAALTGKSVVYDAPTNRVQLRAATSVWSAATISPAFAVVYKDTGSAATSPLLAYIDLGGTQVIAGVDFSLVWDAVEGVLRTTVS